MHFDLRGVFSLFLDCILAQKRLHSGQSLLFLLAFQNLSGQNNLITFVILFIVRHQLYPDICDAAIGRIFPLEVPSHLSSECHLACKLLQILKNADPELIFTFVVAVHKAKHVLFVCGLKVEVLEVLVWSLLGFVLRQDWAWLVLEKFLLKSSMLPNQLLP